jgi:hypothetical protein
MPWCGNPARVGGDCHFKTVGNASSPINENDCGFRREYFPRGFLEKVEPAIEMFVLQPQLEMRRHGAPIIIAGLEDNRRPECSDLRDVMIPVVNCIGKDRPDDFILACASVESGHQLFNGGRIDGRMRLIDENGHDRCLMSLRGKADSEPDIAAAPATIQ